MYSEKSFFSLRLKGYILRLRAKKNKMSFKNLLFQEVKVQKCEIFSFHYRTDQVTIEDCGGPTTFLVFKFSFLLLKIVGG